MTPLGPLPDLPRIVELFKQVPHCRALGMNIIELRHGKGFMSVPFDERLIGNPRTGVVHGGVITALLDSLCGMVVMASVPENTSIATLDLRIDYLHPATPGELIRASAECYKVTQNIAFVRGQAYHDIAQNPIAHCAGAFMLGAVGFSAERTGTPTAGG